MTHIPSLSLCDKRMIPQLGLGTWQVPDAQAASVVTAACEAGYRSFDTATIYENESGTGVGLKKVLGAGKFTRDEFFVTTKVWNSDQGFDKTLKAMDASLKRLGLPYVDLYLIHWPLPMRGLFVDTWRALIMLRDEGTARSIGVSNFNVAHLQRIIDETGVVPAVNQIELHPLLQQAELRAFHAKHGIITESWSPLAQGALFMDGTISRIAQKHKRSVAQIILRWHTELGLVVIPKSVSPERMRENSALFDFRLDADDMTAIAKLELPGGKGRIGPNPETFSMA